MEQAVINFAYSKDYQGFEFDVYESMGAAIGECQSRAGGYDNEEDKQYWASIAEQVEALRCEGKVVIYTEQGNESVEAWTEYSEFNWAWNAVTHDLQDHGYITLTEQ